MSRLAVLALTFSPAALGATLSVPGDHSSIQAAIDAAVTGDIIEISEGTYEEDLDIDMGDGVPFVLTFKPVDGDLVVVAGDSSDSDEANVFDLHYDADITFIDIEIDVDQGGKRGIYARDNVALTYIRGEIRNCNVDDGQTGAGIRLDPGVSAFLEDVVMSNNQPEDASKSGGHFYNHGGYLSLVDVTLEGGEANKGGAVYIQGGTLDATRTTFSNNEASANGGAIYAQQSTQPSGATVLLRASVFQGNVSESSGGAVSLTEGSTLTDIATAPVNPVGEETESSVFDDNYAEEKGGAIYAEDGAVVTLDATVFTDNVVENSDGGALYLTGASGTIDGAQFIGNSANGDDAGAVGLSDASMDIAGCEFTDNAASDNGGAIYANDDSVLTVDATSFTGNLAEDNGGAIYVNNDSVLTVDATLFTNNSSNSEHGGAIYISSSTADIDDCDFIGNIASKHGGAIRWKPDETKVLDVSNSRFELNQAQNGGAVSAPWNDSVLGTLTLTANEFSNNTAEDGGALWAVGTTLTAVHNWWVANEATKDNGGGIRIEAVGGTLENNVFYENVAKTEGAAIYAMRGSGSDPFLLINNHVLGNEIVSGGGGTEGAIYVQDYDLTFINNLVAYTVGGHGAIRDGGSEILVGYNGWFSNEAGDVSSLSQDQPQNGDPLLVDYAPGDGDVSDDTLWPSPISPLRHAGHPDPAYDNPDGSVADIGAFGGPNAIGDLFTTDDDGDQYPIIEDCDDGDSEVNPEGVEAAGDGTDQDCDGLELCYIDQDGDGQQGTESLESDISCTDAGLSITGPDCVDDPGIANAASIYDGATYYTDADEDGYGDVNSETTPATCGVPAGASVDDTDCNDDNAAVFPGATFYTDDDGDGYGDGSAPSALGPTECQDPSPGFSDNADDCDDTDTLVFPGATYYEDADGDGYGNADSTFTLAADECAAPFAGWTTDGSDCDDTDANVFPDATYYLDSDGDSYGDAAAPHAPTECGLPADYSVNADDCDDDGSDDTIASVARLVYPEATYYEDADGDQFGNLDQAHAPSGCGMPAGYSVDATDCDDDDTDDTVASVAAQIFPGATYYADADADSYGDAANSTSPGSCGLPAGYSVRDDDCDDDASDDEAPRNLAALVYPGAIYYLDSDSDNYGDSAFPYVAVDCTLLSDHSVDGTDCADDDPDTRPDGTEIIGNEHDEDCSGDVQCWRDDDADSFGHFTDFIDDLDADDSCTSSGESESNTDCDDLAVEVFPGAMESQGDGIDSDCNCVYADDPQGTGIEGSDFGFGCGGPEADDDGDGLSFLVEQSFGTSDANTDSDLDGVGDGDEVGPQIGTDPMNADSDFDGIDDGIEIGPDLGSPSNSDGDEQIDALDDDDDNDGILTADEVDGVGGTPLDLNTDACTYVAPSNNIPWECDEVPNYLDDDDDGDHQPTVFELEQGPSDLDGIDDYLDYDDDDDGIPSYWEVTTIVEHNGSQVSSDPRHVDSDGDSIGDFIEWNDDTLNAPDYANPRNSDAGVDDLYNAIDSDDDGDLIPSGFEGTADEDCTGPDGLPNYLDDDSDGDGKLDIDEGLEDTDGDEDLDFLDCTDDGSSGDLDCDEVSNGTEEADEWNMYVLAPDSDFDGVPDLTEKLAHDNAPDPDGDDIIAPLDGDDDGDTFDTVDELGLLCNPGTPNEEVPVAWDGDPCERDPDIARDSFSFLWVCSDGSEPVPRNTDAYVGGVWPLFPDDVPDYLDDDDDGDGILTEAEADMLDDIDGDGVANYLDTNDYNGPAADADGDGLTNGVEEGISDPYSVDSDGDGVPDGDEFGEDGPLDTDGDDIDDIIDDDDDNDDIPTSEEGTGDADGDGVPNYLDEDSDGDGINDIDEDAGDIDCDGTPNFLDSNSTDGPCQRGTDADLYDAPAEVQACAGCAAGGVQSGLWVVGIGMLTLLRRRRRECPREWTGFA